MRFAEETAVFPAALADVAESEDTVPLLLEVPAVVPDGTAVAEVPVVLSEAVAAEVPVVLSEAVVPAGAAVVEGTAVAVLPDSLMAVDWSTA